MYEEIDSVPIKQTLLSWVTSSSLSGVEALFFFKYQEMRHLTDDPHVLEASVSI